MHKIHIITKPDGTLLVIGVLNPNMPEFIKARAKAELRVSFGDTATVAVVPYATQVEVHDATLFTAIKRWWRGRRLRTEGELKS